MSDSTDDVEGLYDDSEPEPCPDCLAFAKEVRKLIEAIYSSVPDQVRATEVYAMLGRVDAFIKERS